MFCVESFWHTIGWWENFNRKALYLMVKTHGFPIFLTFFHHVSHPKKRCTTTCYRCSEPRQFAQQLATSGLTAPREDWMSFAHEPTGRQRDSICRTKPLCTLYAYFNSQENIWILIWIQKKTEVDSIKSREWQWLQHFQRGRSRRRWSSSHYAWFTGMCCGWQLVIALLHQWNLDDFDLHRSFPFQMGTQISSTNSFLTPKRDFNSQLCARCAVQKWVEICQVKSATSSQCGSEAGWVGPLSTPNGRNDLHSIYM